MSSIDFDNENLVLLWPIIYADPWSFREKEIGGLS